MTEPLRLAGNGRRPDGSIVTWTVSEGRRGRRWREVVTRDDAVVHALLLETDPQRRFTHLELSIPGALVTLHPDGDGTLHGNRVRADGSNVTHVRGQAFGPGAFVVVAGSPVSWASVAWAMLGVVEVPGIVDLPVVFVRRDGSLSPTIMFTLARMDDEAWAFDPSEGGEGSIPDWMHDGFRVAASGIPLLQVGTWVPLEG